MDSYYLQISVRGFIANTDYDWYRFLRTQTALEEVNFWQPSGSRDFGAVLPGSPFFFKLKRPHYAVAGYGFFLRASILPAWLAWDSFGPANGAPNFDTMKRRIEKYRGSEAKKGRDPFEIGCLMITQPVFFPEDQWISQPSDWSPNIVQGKTYDLTTGEGAALWDRCLAQTPASAGQPATVSEPGARYGREGWVQARLGQGTFRISVLEAYQRACAVTGEHSLPALEAAHIRPYSEDGPNEITNGLLLRADVHRLFDLGYVTVSPGFRFEVSRRLKEDFENGRSYYPLHGRPITLPRETPERPDRNLLEWHSQTRFLG